MNRLKTLKKMRRRQGQGVDTGPVPVPKFLGDVTSNFAYLPGNVLVADSEGTIQYVTPRTLAAMGYEPADMIGQAMVSFWDQPEMISKHIMAQLERDHFWQGEIRQRLKGPNREPIRELVSLSMVPGDRPGEAYIVKMGQPIPGHRQDASAAASLEADTDLLTLINAIPYAINIYRLSDLKFLEVNDSFCKDTGYTKQEVVGRTAVELGLWKDLGDREKYLEAFERDGRIDDIELPFMSKHGERIDALLSARRIMFRGQACAITTSKDITQLKKTQRALEDSESLYRNLMEAAPENIVLTRMSDGKMVHANSAFYQRSGWSPEESLGRTTLELGIYVNPEDRDRFVSILRKEGRVDSFQVAVRFKDGTTSHEMWSARVIEIFGEPHLVVVTRDISELMATRQALEESERNYRTILEATPNSVAVSRIADSRYVLVNDAFTRTLGYSRQEVIEKYIPDLNLFVDPADRERFLAKFRSEGRVDGMALQFRKKDGSITESLVSAMPIQYANEPCLLAITTNIDRIKQIQRELEESEASYRSILELAPYAIIVSRLSDSRLIQLNDAFCRHSGYSREEATGRTPTELLLYADPVQQEKMIDEFHRTGRIGSMDFQLRTKDGSSFESLFSATTITYKGEACMLAMTVDVTKQKAAERALRRSEQKYRNVLMNMEEGYWEMDLKGHFSFINEAQCHIYGCAAKNLIGKNIDEYAVPEMEKRIQEIFDEVCRTGQSSTLYDYEMVREDGSRIIIETSVSLRKDENGTPIGFFGVARDITEKKKAADELEKYRKHLEDMVRERTQALQSAQNELVKREKLSVLGQLTATVGHDLRNPLGVIKSSNYFLKQKVGSNDAKLDKHLKRIDEQVALCNLIVADLLEYTRGRSVELENRKLTAWLGQMIEQLEETENFIIEKQIPETLPPVPHDQEKMRRVCINLIENALHAVRAQAEALEASERVYHPKICVTARQTGAAVEIEVRDNGIGMDEITREHAFEPLFTTRARGTGIGLANVRKIVSEHNGDVTLASEPDRGTTVIVKLPCPIDKE